MALSIWLHPLITYCVSDLYLSSATSAGLRIGTLRFLLASADGRRRSIRCVEFPLGFHNQLTSLASLSVGVWWLCEAHSMTHTGCAGRRVVQGKDLTRTGSPTRLSDVCLMDTAGRLPISPLDDCCCGWRNVRRDATLEKASNDARVS